MSNAFGNWLEETEVKDLATLGNGRKTEKKEYPCGSCRGTGVWTSMYGHKSGKCFSCKGTGFFTTSPAARSKGRANRASAKAKKIKAFTEANKELIAFLRDNTSWNSFARSLLESLDTKGEIHPNGVAAGERMMAKTLATRAKKAAEKAAEEASAPVVDLTKIHDLFATALANGKNRRALLGGEGMKITPAPERSKNAGFLYIKVNGEYCGKVSPDGKYLAGWGNKVDVETDLMKIAADPAGEARLYGLRTKSCACCGLTLTHPDSIKAGIGPICADKWGL